MSDPKPSVGRIVHCHTSTSADGGTAPCRAALITSVHEGPASGSWVSLTVFGPTGLQFILKAPHVDEAPDYYVTPDGTGPTWHWPERV